jgi:hypothetical protein
MHILFYLIAMHCKKLYSGDSAEYIQEAVNIRDHFFFYCGNLALPIKEEYITMRPPVYPLFLTLVYFFTISAWVVITLQNLVSVLNICYLRDTFLRLGYKKKYDWIFLLFVFVYPIQFIYSDTVSADILMQTFVIMYFRHFVLLVYDNKLSSAWWMSVAVILGAFVKPIFYPFALINLVVLLLWSYREKLKISKVLFIAIVPVFVFMLYNTWNYERTGKFHFSSIESINATVNYQTYMTRKVGALKATELHEKIRAELAVIPSYKDRYDSSIRIANRFLKEHLWSYAAFHLMHTGRIFIEPGKAEIDLFTGWLTPVFLGSEEGAHKGFYATIGEKGWSSLGNYIHENKSMPFVMLILIFNCLRIVGFILFLFARQIPIIVRTFILLLIFYFALVVGPVANTHYFLPVSLIMIGAAILGFQQWAEKRKTRIK